MGSRHGKPELGEEDLAQLVATSGLSEEEIRNEFNNFLAEHPDGKIRRREFKKMLKVALPGKDASSMEKHMFRCYDENDNGYIDPAEFMIVFHIMSDGTAEEALARIFRVFDISGDGIISERELKRIVKDMYKLIKEEAPEEATKSFITENAFAEMDEDENGKVTLEEFTAACMHTEQFSKMLTLKIIDIFLEDD